MTSNSAQNQQNVCSKKTVAQSQQLSPQVNRSYQLPKFMPPVEAPEKPKKKKCKNSFQLCAVCEAICISLSDF